jgi:hypothetical protein
MSQKGSKKEPLIYGKDLNSEQMDAIGMANLVMEPRRVVD